MDEAFKPRHEEKGWTADNDWVLTFHVGTHSKVF